MIAYHDYIRKQARKILKGYQNDNHPKGSLQLALKNFVYYKEHEETDPRERIVTKDEGAEPAIGYRSSNSSLSDAKVYGLNKGMLDIQYASSKSIVQFLENTRTSRRKTVAISAKLFKCVSEQEFMQYNDPESGDHYFRDDPRYWIQAANNLTEIRLRVNLYLEALNELPRNSSIIKNLGITLYEAGRYDEAEKYLKMAIRIAPDDADNHSNYGLFLHEIRKDLIGAETYLRRAYELEPMHRNNNMHYAWLLHAMKNYKEAEKQYKLALKINPENFTVLGNYGWLLSFEKFSPHKGLPLLERALELQPNDPVFLGTIAFVNATYNLDFDKAERFFEKSIQLAPTSYIKHGNYSQLLFARGKIDRAIKHLLLAKKYGRADEELLLELSFYLYAHCDEQRVPSEQHIADSLNKGVRSPLKNFSITLVSAIESGHPDKAKLLSYAERISELSYTGQGQLICNS
ncbi:MAG: tetratricopeptide repeat protein [Bacteroidetes bacterium]|nr:tetratricopeptide repeat protein [Bacteroidota bacterium]